MADFDFKGTAQAMLRSEPTKEQIEAGVAAARDWDLGRDGGLYFLIPAIYRAMEAAKPKLSMEEQAAEHLAGIPKGAHG